MPRLTDPDAAGGGLAILGLRAGEPVRWRAGARRGWRAGVVSHRERDGSIGVWDEQGGARSLPVEALQVARHGARGGRGWEPLTVRASRCEQLRLFPPEPPPGGRDLRPAPGPARRPGRRGRPAGGPPAPAW